MTPLSDIITIVLYCILLYSSKRDWPPCKVVFRVGNQNTKCDKQQQSNVFVLLRQYYPRKLLGPLKSGMGRGLRPSVASLVERTPAARPLLSIGRASGSTSGSASRGGRAAEKCILLPRDLGSSYLFAYNDTKSGPTLFFALTIRLSSPLSYHPAGFRNPFRGDISSGQYGSIIRASC